MDDLLEEKIKDIGAMFGITDIPDSITDLVGSFIHPEKNPILEDDGKICLNCEQNNAHPDQDIDVGKIIELVKKYQSAKHNAEHDQNIQLLRALEPFLSKKKQKKIKNCEKMLTIMKMI